MAAGKYVVMLPEMSRGWEKVELERIPISEETTWVFYTRLVRVNYKRKVGRRILFLGKRSVWVENRKRGRAHGTGVQWY